MQNSHVTQNHRTPKKHMFFIMNDPTIIRLVSKYLSGRNLARTRTLSKQWRAIINTNHTVSGNRIRNFERTMPEIRRLRNEIADLRHHILHLQHILRSMNHPNQRRAVNQNINRASANIATRERQLTRILRNLTPH
jgi:hypothetical protein